MAGIRPLCRLYGRSILPLPRPTLLPRTLLPRSCMRYGDLAQKSSSVFLSSYSRDGFELGRPILLSQRFSSSPGNEEFKIIEFEDMKERCLEKNSWILDCRNPDELADLGYIPGAKNIPVGEMPQAFFTDSAESFVKTYGFPRPSENEDIVVYCRSGKRAVTACQVLQQAGYKKLFLYKGSWLDWVEKKGPM